ncbi:hypothetical protein [Stutzerimonas chloritidismutans]|uniref:hypothetical protein n=1 Tax=Stutzerimonas chloritidismutans TaxID=203192 RepID=UPI003F18C283
MDMRVLLLSIGLSVTGSVLAEGTGPTHPEKSRTHPLDTREPRQDVIEQPGDKASSPRPPTLEAPPAVPPPEPTERRQPGDTTPPPPGEATGAGNASSG